MLLNLKVVAVFLFFFLFASGFSRGETLRPHESESFQQGLETGRSLRNMVLENPGELLFGPAVGQGEFRTFTDNPDEGVTFSAPVLGDETYAEFNRVRICLSGATDSGLGLLLETASHSYSLTVSLVGDNGFAIKSDADPDWLSPGTSYYFWVYDSATGEVGFDEGAAHSAAQALGVSLYEALGSPMCVAPTHCPGLDVNTVVLNFDLILSKLGRGILRRIHRTDPETLVSNYSGESAPNCVAYSILRPTDAADPNALRCWMGPKGTLPTCESIKSLEERGENFNRGISHSVLSPGEALILAGRESRTPFYKDEETGFEVKSPYALIKERTEGAALGGGAGKVQVKVCQVGNFPWGSTLTGWVNNVEGFICEQGDWECIRRAVAQKCGIYELDDNCVLMEETVDGVPSIQFGHDTGLAFVAGSGPTGGASIRCWYFIQPYRLTPEQKNDYVAFYNAYAPDWVKADPRFDPTADDSMKLMKGDDNWLTCGDFQTITRKYYCRNDVEMCKDMSGSFVPCWDQAALTSAIERSLGITENLGSVYDPSTDTLTGSFKYAPGGGWVSSSLPLSEMLPGFMESENVSCSDEEKTCVVAWCGDERIVGGENGGLPPTDCSHVRKEVRQCEKDEVTGDLYCPITPEESSLGAWVVADCSCRSFLGEALGYLSMLRTISHDIKCGDEYTDPTTNQIKQMEEEFYDDCEEDGDELLAMYVCGKQRTDAEQAEWLVCQPKPEQRPEPFTPIKAALWVNDNYRCQLTHIYQGEWKASMDFGYMSVFPKWFDYCVDTYRDAVQTYIEEGIELNRDYPPSGLCSPSLAHTSNYNLSRPYGCGYDDWEIVSGPSRSNLGVALHPGSEFPFGFVSLGYALHREYDCMKTGLDCNSDNWLDFFNCAWRNDGYDCNRDCIADNNYYYCNRISGWDCHKYDGCDRKEYDKCEYRSSGYDYNDDCRRDSSNSMECSDRYFVPPSKKKYKDCGTTPCSSCTGCSTKSTYSCNCSPNPSYMYFCWNGTIYAKSSSSYPYPSCSPDNTLLRRVTYRITNGQCERRYVSVCYPKDDPRPAYKICSYDGCCNGYEHSLMFMSYCYMSCDTCYECWEKVPGEYVAGGYYCGSFSQYGCDLSGPKDCKYVSGYDCGRNGGPEANQNPDGCIDNNYRYCCHVAQGWDCSGADAPTPYIQNIRNNLPNDRIIAGTCDVPQNLADSVCGTTYGARRQYRCSRKDHPGQCCHQNMTYDVRIKIENHNQQNAGHYRCRALDDHFSPPIEVDRRYNDEGIVMYDNPATEVNDEARFLTEGCREQYNRIYFAPDASVPLGTVTRDPVDPAFYTGFIPTSILWKYIAYEDFIRIAAEEKCEWRDYLQKCYCVDLGDGPSVLQEHAGRYIFYEDMQDPEVEGL